MIIGIDGNVATGKTTLARRLANMMSARLVPEYQPHADEHAEVGSVRQRWRLQEHYLTEERLRARELHRGEQVLLDRTVVSQAAHVYVSVGRGVDVRPSFAAHLRNCSDTDVVVPDVLVLLVGDPPRTQSRLERREAGPDRRSTAPTYACAGYLAAYDGFLSRLAERLPKRTLLTEPCPDAGAVQRSVRATTRIGEWPELRAALLCELETPCVG